MAWEGTYRVYPTSFLITTVTAGNIVALKMVLTFYQASGRRLDSSDRDLVLKCLEEPLASDGQIDCLALVLHTFPHVDSKDAPFTLKDHESKNRYKRERVETRLARARNIRHETYSR